MFQFFFPKKETGRLSKLFTQNSLSGYQNFFCIFQSEATDNGIPVILNLFNVEYIELMDSELRGPASTLLDIVDIVSRATSVYYFHPSPLPMLFIANVSMPSCIPTLRGRGGGRGAVSCVPINVSVWGCSSDLVIMFYS